MTNIKNFNALSILLAERGVKKRIVVVNPDDESTLWALDKARRSGFCETIIVDDDDRPTAARKAVQLVREGKADVLMKGFINTDVLLHAILNKEYGILEPGSVMTHITAASLPAYDKLIFFTDAAVIPYPTQEQRVQQVRYMVNLCHSFGIDLREGRRPSLPLHRGLRGDQEDGTERRLRTLHRRRTARPEDILRSSCHAGERHQVTHQRTCRRAYLPEHRGWKPLL